MRKKKQLPVEKVHIDKLVHGGQGMGLLPDGKKCFIWGSLPGEDALVQLTRNKKDWSEGYVTELLVQSKDRVEPEEPDMYLATSPWQILHYDKEASVKQSILHETFTREGVEVDMA